MTNREIVTALREAANQKRMEYVAYSVKAKLIRKTLKESLFRGKPINEEVTPAASAPGMGGTSAKTPSDVAQPRHSRLGSGAYKEPIKPEELENSMIAALDAPLSDTDPAVVFGTGSGPGTYRDLLKQLAAAEKAASSAATSAMTAESMVDAFQNLYPNFSPEEKKMVRGAARKYLLGMKKGFGGGIK